MAVCATVEERRFSAAVGFDMALAPNSRFQVSVIIMFRVERKTKNRHPIDKICQVWMFAVLLRPSLVRQDRTCLRNP
jgi:hypothetical protein